MRITTKIKQALFFSQRTIMLMTINMATIQQGHAMCLLCCGTWG